MRAIRASPRASSPTALATSRVVARICSKFSAGGTSTTFAPVLASSGRKDWRDERIGEDQVGMVAKDLFGGVVVDRNGRSLRPLPERRLFPRQEGDGSNARRRHQIEQQLIGAHF